VRREQENQPDQELQRERREKEQRGEERRDQDRRGPYPRSKLSFQATSARFVASSCSLVRPKRRSRLR
jgi:hypothetical protein